MKSVELDQPPGSLSYLESGAPSSNTVSCPGVQQGTWGCVDNRKRKGLGAFRPAVPGRTGLQERSEECSFRFCLWNPTLAPSSKFQTGQEVSRGGGSDWQSEAPMGRKPPPCFTSLVLLALAGAASTAVAQPWREQRPGQRVRAEGAGGGCRGR